MVGRRMLVLAAMLLMGAAGTPPDAQVVIDNFSFSPATITVPVGTRVVWTNRDDIPHRVADSTNPAKIRSAALDTGDSYGRVYAKAGAYPYFCSLHPHMQGTVIVR